MNNNNSDRFAASCAARGSAKKAAQAAKALLEGLRSLEATVSAGPAMGQLMLDQAGVLADAAASAASAARASAEAYEHSVVLADGTPDEVAAEAALAATRDAHLCARVAARLIYRLG